METTKYRGCTIEVMADDGIESPREWDNLGTMVCSHKRYDLGDEQFKEDRAGSWEEAMAYYFEHDCGLNIEYDYYMSEAQVERITKWIDKNI